MRNDWVLSGAPLMRTSELAMKNVPGIKFTIAFGFRMPPLPAWAAPMPRTGKFVQRFRADIVADVAGFRIQERSGRGDGDRFRRSAYFERDIDAQDLGDFDGQARAGIFLESRRGHGQFIRTDGQLRDRVVAGVGSSAIVGDACYGVFCLHGDVGNHGAGRVGNRAGDGAAVALRDRRLYGNQGRNKT